MTAPHPRLPSPRLALAALLGVAACAPYTPPFTAPSTPATPAPEAASEVGPGAASAGDPRVARLVFLWPATSCDPAGYFTLATARGRFIGNIARGSRLAVELPPGETTVVAWNDVVETATGEVNRSMVPVLRADLREGRTYYARMLFGEWDARGPRDHVFVRGVPSALGRCLKTPAAATSAMVGISPASEEWSDVAEWDETLGTLVPDRSGGQAWLDANRDELASHVALGQDRFADLRPDGRRRATIAPDDGAPGAPR
jgi:hypothetical protein